MPEVPRVQGPGGPMDSGGKGKVPTDSDKFKEMMKVEKVNEVDPEEKKKRKRREEQEDEGEELAPPPAARPLVKDTILTPQEKDMKIGSARAEGPLKASTTPPSEDSPTTSQATPRQPGATVPAESSPEDQETKTGQLQTQQNVSLTPKSSDQKAAQELQKPEESAEGLIAARAKEKSKEFEKAGNEEITKTLGPSEGTLDVKKKRKDDSNLQTFSGESPISTPFTEGQSLPLASVSGLPSYISPQVYALFEKMVGVITVMVESDVKETSITLNSPEFATSPFFGSQIIIQEYSTAPNQFNIQIIGNSDAVKIFEGNAQDLLASLNSGKYNFRINRLDVGEKPLFRRKEKLSDEKRDNLG